MSTQLLFFSLAFRLAFSWRWKRSTSPLHCGWKDVVLLILILSSDDSSFQRLDMNCFPLYDVIYNGIPNRDIHVIRALVQSSAVWSFMGMASGHRVYLSMIVNKYLFSLDVGMGPTISTWMLVKRCDGVRNDFNGVFTCLSTLDCWQGKHSLDHCIASLLMLCHTNLANSRRRVVFLPGWDKLCIKLNTFLFKLSGIIGVYYIDANAIRGSIERDDVTGMHLAV